MPSSRSCHLVRQDVWVKQLGAPSICFGCPLPALCLWIACLLPPCLSASCTQFVARSSFALPPFAVHAHCSAPVLWGPLTLLLSLSHSPWYSGNHHLVFPFLESPCISSPSQVSTSISFIFFQTCQVFPFEMYCVWDIFLHAWIYVWKYIYSELSTVMNTVQVVAVAMSKSW